MKKVFLNFTGLFVLAILAMSFNNPAPTYKVNVNESLITWKGYKVTGEHYGDLKIKSGELQFDGDVLTGGQFTMDMTSIAVRDLEGEWAGKLEGHLKSPDFFGVEAHPTAKFVIKQAVSRGTPGDYKIVGDLTIKGITKEIRFLAHLDDNGSKMSANADVQLDRSEFDIRYGSGSFFDNLGDKTIYDEFDLTIALVVNK